jgi:hypothetical protein
MSGIKRHGKRRHSDDEEQDASYKSPFSRRKLNSKSSENVFTRKSTRQGSEYQKVSYFNA